MVGGGGGPVPGWAGLGGTKGVARGCGTALGPACNPGSGQGPQTCQVSSGTCNPRRKVACFFGRSRDASDADSTRAGTIFRWLVTNIGFEWLLLEECWRGPTWRPAAGLGDRPLPAITRPRPLVDAVIEKRPPKRPSLPSQHNDDDLSCICLPISAMKTQTKKNKPELHPELETSLGWGSRCHFS